MSELRHGERELSQAWLAVKSGETPISETGLRFGG
jgi:hypothetical protein